MKKTITIATLTICFLTLVGCNGKQQTKQLPPEQYIIKSSHSFDQTVALLKTTFAQKKITLFTEIDHTAAAQSVDMQMLPATLLIVGNPSVGTPLMKEDPQIAIALPLKVLITQDTAGEVSVSYQPISSISSGYKLGSQKDKPQLIDQKMSTLIQKTVVKE